MSTFVDVALPAAVRRQFTYHVPDELERGVQEGQRVWIPFRNYYAIGVIVRVHDQIPSFKTKPVRKILDEQPLLSKELLELTGWISKFYYASWGETIQAALPAGLNFVSRKYLNVAEKCDDENLSDEEREIISELRENKTTLDEAKKRWKGTGLNQVLSKLLKAKKIEIWEEPDMKVSVSTEREWIWADNKSKMGAKEYLNSEEVNESLKWTKALAEISRLIPVRQSDLPDDPLFNSYSMRKLQDENWITFREVDKKSDIENLDHDPDSIKTLNTDQQNAFEKIGSSIQENEFANYLLFGITGSGKTEVYIHALKQVVESGKGGIVLVPEIALTPQTVSRFYRIFGDEIALLHSRMSAAERLQAWKDLDQGKKKIAIGPRSAVFAPVQNLGIIILDEEHDSSYKQMDPAPRYHARETAIVRARMNAAVVIMGTATPSMQALNMAAKDKCEMLELKDRHADAVLPEVEIVDLKQYKGKAMKGEFAASLYIAMEEALKRNEQIILLYNRRGYASYLQCEDCGHIPESPESSVSLTFHKRKNLLMDHYTGYARRKDTQCENCGSPNLKVQGSGTQNVEEQLETLFPEANVIRFDRDSTSRKGAHERILKEFGDGKADILIGTQLVAKGLDFPNVTVVGVVNADTELAFPSFQATERMYQLLSQVSGRSGRGDKPGTVFLQTRQPENPALIFAKEHDHRGFARQEMEFRKPLYYPPYSRLIKFELKSSDEQKVNMAAHTLKRSAEQVVPDVPVLGPSPSAIPWLNRKYLWEVTLKIEPEKGGAYIEMLLDKVLEVYEGASKGKWSSVRINVNVDAIQ
ncbi:primosomal protein N' [Gracilimonas sp. Q87]|uniref:replication restart helicase PriA n=1 Tax=Gracilimonas sp. Q87 TaxID=3384766 RepID=UPI0039844B09